MKTNRKNPYLILRDKIRSFIASVKFRHSVDIFFWDSKNLTPSNTWRLDTAYQKILVAQQLGYEAVFTADEKGMTLKFKKIITPPSEWTY